MGTRNEEIRRQLGFGLGRSRDMHDMAFTVKYKVSEVEPEPTAVPAVLCVSGAEGVEAPEAVRG